MGHYVLFLDGALKENPKEAGARGVIFHPNEEREIKCSQGLGISTNNQAEYLALWKGMNLSYSKGIDSLW